MIRQIKLLTWLRLVNLMGFNEARFSRDRKKRAKLTAMLVLYGILALVMMAYVGLMCWGVAALGAGSKLPLCLAVVSGLVVLVFTVLRAGPVLFETGDYEMLISLPVRPTAVVVSRFAAMYFSNAAMTLAVLLPGMIVSGFMLKPGFAFYPMMLLGAIFLPLIPMTIAMLLGMLVYMLSARMKRRKLAVLFFSMLATLAVLILPLLLAKLQPDQLILGIRTLLDSLRSFYPPAGWFGDAVSKGNIGAYMLFAVGSAAVFGAAAGIVGWKFRSICDLLSSHRSRSDFRMEAQRSTGMRKALYLRELRRYFASPIYVMNTGVGYVLAVILAAGVIVSGISTILDELPVPIELAPRVTVFILAFCYVLSPTTTSAISLEGKSWWLLKSLPVPAAEIMGSKLMVNLTIALPCWLVSTVLLFIGIRPEGIAALWLVLLPLGYILFSACLGLKINLKLPMFSWENESQPVKQGKAVLVCMLIGMAVSILPAIALVLLPASLRDVFSGMTFAGLLAGAFLLWRSCVRCNLAEVN